MSLAADTRATFAPSASRAGCASPCPTRAGSSSPRVQLLHDAGLPFEDGTRALTARVEGFPLDILFVRTDDIVEFVADGVADLGITGTNLLVESGADLDDPQSSSGYGHCRLEVAVPHASTLRAFEDLAGLPPGHESPAGRGRRARAAGRRGRHRDHQRRRRGRSPAWASRTASSTSSPPARRCS